MQRFDALSVTHQQHKELPFDITGEMVSIRTRPRYYRKGPLHVPAMPKAEVAVPSRKFPNSEGDKRPRTAQGGRGRVSSPTSAKDVPLRADVIHWTRSSKRLVLSWLARAFIRLAPSAAARRKVN